MLRFVRANFEIYLDHFRSIRIQKELFNQFLSPELQVFHSEWRTGVTGINEQLFEIVTSFTHVLNTLV